MECQMTWMTTTIWPVTDAEIAPPQNRPRTATKKTAVQRLMFGFRVHEARQMGDMGENKPKR